MVLLIGMGGAVVFMLKPVEAPPSQLSVSVPPAKVAEIVPQPPPTPEPPPAATTELPDVVTLPGTGELIPVWTEDEVVPELRTALQGLATSQIAYEAAFDDFTGDMDRVGWEPSGDVRYYVAFWIDFTQQHPLRAAITRGPGRGRLFASTIKGPSVVELERLSETELLAMLNQVQWRGNQDAWYPGE